MFGIHFKSIPKLLFVLVFFGMLWPEYSLFYHSIIGVIISSVLLSCFFYFVLLLFWYHSSLAEGTSLTRHFSYINTKIKHNMHENRTVNHRQLLYYKNYVHTWQIINCINKTGISIDIGSHTSITFPTDNDGEYNGYYTRAYRYGYLATRKIS